MKRNATFAGNFALSALAAAALSGASVSTWALGLGRLQVNSALGESLRAEIDIVSLSPEEATNLRLRVASPDAYRAAGIEYNAVLPGTQVELRRRADGRPFLRLSSDRGVQEPFVDVILEINWSTGRLVREYTLLFDPPNIARTPTPGGSGVASLPASPAEYPAVPRSAELRSDAVAKSSPPSPPSSLNSTTAKVAGGSMARDAKSTPPAKREKVGAQEYRVKAGDSLSRIAARTQRPGVSLDQMLVSLYRDNPQAFIDRNMNRLKSGAVLSVPAAQSAQAITESDARQFIQAQSADFGAYRQRLAAGLPAARADGSSRRAGGNVQSSVGESQAAVTADKLTLTKDVASGADSTAEVLISKGKEKRADELRIAELSKNLADLKRLSGATAGASTAPSAASPSATASPAGRASAGAASEMLRLATPGAASTPAPSASLTTLTPAEPAIATAPIVPLVPSPRAMSGSPVAPLAPNPSTASELAALLEHNPAALGLGGLILTMLGAFGIYKIAKRARKDSGETSFLESRLQPDSFFGGSGGQRIDTRDASGASSSMSYSLSQLDAIGDVDPVAEADVYLAYGRDLQAEEILKEAMRSTPQRLAIRTKLLEVYAKRRDTKGFELLATQMFALTHGEGEDWVKAQEMGAQIDPENSLYQPGGTPLVALDGGEVNELLGASTMPQSVLPTPSQFGDSVTSVLPVNQSSVDIDLGLDLDLDLDLDNPGTGSPADTRHQAHSPVKTPDFQSSDRPLSLDLSAFGAPAAFAGDAAEPRPFNLADISFDLDLPDTLPSEHEAAPAPASVFNEIDLASPVGLEDTPEDALVRQLELAEEFRQIGDADGARDLLQEVLTKASGAVKIEAERMLAALG